MRRPELNDSTTNRTADERANVLALEIAQLIRAPLSSRVLSTRVDGRVLTIGVADGPSRNRRYEIEVREVED